MSGETLRVDQVKMQTQVLLRWETFYVDENGMVHGYNDEEELFPSREEAVRVLEGTIARLDAALVEEAQDFWVFRDEAGRHLVVSILPASECGGEE